MANVNNPRGFEPVQPILRMRYYTKGTATAMYPGDAVSMSPDGKVYLRATGSISIAGVVQSYKTASDTSVLLIDDADQQYYLKDDGIGATIALTNAGNGFNITMTTGNTTFLKSAQALDVSTANAATATRQLVMLGLHPDDEVGKYARVRVIFKPAALIQTRAGFM